MKISNIIDDEFLDWLDQCPYQWQKIEDDQNSITYIFFKDNELL